MTGFTTVNRICMCASFVTGAAHREVTLQKTKEHLISPSVCVDYVPVSVVLSLKNECVNLCLFYDLY